MTRGLKLVINWPSVNRVLGYQGDPVNSQGSLAVEKAAKQEARDAV